MRSRGWRTFRSTTATPTGRSSTPTPRSTGPTLRSRSGSPGTWRPRKGRAWRFVSFHQPGFNSSKKHFDEQQMRVLAPVFEAGKVDVVFNGHVHNYQRSYPMHFVPSAEKAATVAGKDGKQSTARHVDGKWTLDKKFNGQSDTTPMV